MRRIVLGLGGIAVLCGALYGYAAWHRERWYAQDFRADFNGRVGGAVQRDTVQVIELSSGGRLVCGQAAGTHDGVRSLYGVRYMPTLFGGDVDVLAAPGQGSAADGAYLKTACS